MSTEKRKDSGVPKTAASCLISSRLLSYLSYESGRSQNRQLSVAWPPVYLGSETWEKHVPRPAIADIPFNAAVWDSLSNETVKEVSTVGLRALPVPASPFPWRIACLQ